MGLTISTNSELKDSVKHGVGVTFSGASLLKQIIVAVVYACFVCVAAGFVMIGIMRIGDVDGLAGGDGLYMASAFLAGGIFGKYSRYLYRRQRGF